MAKEKKINGDSPSKKTSKKASVKKASELTLDWQEEDNSSTKIVEPLLKIKEVDTLEKGNHPIEGVFDDKKENHSFFSVDNAIFLQIHVGNIYAIFGSGLIVPSKYIRSRAFSDPQSLDHDSLILSNGILMDEDESIALLEINLLARENNFLSIFDNIAFLDKPIPISRIKKIYVSSERIKKEIVTTSLTSDGGIIPEDLIISSLPSGAPRIKLKKTDAFVGTSDYTSKINQFNKILGTLAFLKNYSVLLCNKTNSISTYPEHYFYAIQALNNSSLFKVVTNEKATLFYRQLFMLQNGIDSISLKWIFERINNNENFNNEDVKDFGSIFLNNPNSREFFNEARDIFNSLTKSLERKNTIKKILQLPTSEKFSLYLFAFLRTYGNANTEEKSISRIDMPEFLSPLYGEFVFSILGYFYGYNILRNYDDKQNIIDKTFKDVTPLSQRLSIKFDLTTMFEYIIIESVYSNVFFEVQEKIDSSFLESASIKKEWPLKQTLNLPANYAFKIDEIFGKQVYHVSKKILPDISMEKINKLPLQIPIISDLGVYCFRNKITRHYSNIGDLFLKEGRMSFFIFFKKEDILEAINGKKINQQEVLMRIDMDIAAKEL